MAIITIETLANLLKEKAGAIAGLDLGSKTIGVAISDLSYFTANPRFTLKRKKFLLDAMKLLEYLKQENVVAIVIGLPINMNGTSGPRVQSTQSFIQNMSKITDIPFILQDERLSTIAAERNLLEFDFSRQKRATLIDASAAAHILQTALDRLRSII